MTSKKLKKIIEVLKQIEVLELKFGQKEEIKINYSKLILLGLINGKNTTNQIKRKGEGVTPFNIEGNKLLKEGILKIVTQGKKKIDGNTSYALDVTKLLRKIFSDCNTIGEVLIIESFYSWFEKNYKFVKEETDRLICYLKDKENISLKQGDPIGYSGKFFTDDRNINYSYILRK